MSTEISGCCDKIRIKFDQEAYCNECCGIWDCQKESCASSGYGTWANPNVDYYGPYTTGYWHEYEAFRKMAGFDGEVGTDGTIYYDFEIMYEDDLSYAMVNDRVVYKSATGADMYVVHGGFDNDYPACGMYQYVSIQGWQVVNPTTLSQFGDGEAFDTDMEP